MIKFVLLIVAICFTVASAQSVTALFLYRASADCSDPSKVIQVRAYNSSDIGCTPDFCSVFSNATYTAVTRCYKTYNEIPLPSNAITLSQSPAANCSETAFGITFVVPNVCIPSVNPFGSRYVASCNSTSLGLMVCDYLDDCSECVLDTRYGKENQCSNTRSYSCKADFSSVNGPTTPSAGPVAGSAPVGAPVATPARRSSATQVAMNIVGLLISMTAFVF